MSLPEVRQAQYLAHTLSALVQKCGARSVAVLGCAGGNGLDRLAPEQVERVVGVDINPDYIAVMQRRYKDRFQKLEALCCDVLSTDCCFSEVDVVFAGLLFEYLDAEAALAHIAQFTRPGGHAGVLLQLPNDTIGLVTPSPFASLDKLKGYMRLVPPSQIEHLGNAQGFRVVSSECTVLATGKAFQEIVFQKPVDDIKILSDSP